MAPLPQNARSERLSRKALAAFNRIGDIMLPRHGDYPSFSELGCIQHVDDVVLYAPEDDVHELGTFLTVLYFCPDSILRFVVWLTQNAGRFPRPLAAFFRLLDMGLRSVVITLYYAGKASDEYTGKTPIELIGYRVNPVRP